MWREVKAPLVRRHWGTMILQQAMFPAGELPGGWHRARS